MTDHLIKSCSNVLLPRPGGYGRVYQALICSENEKENSVDSFVGILKKQKVENKKVGNSLFIKSMATFASAAGVVFMEALRKNDGVQIAQSGRDLGKIADQVRLILGGKKYLELSEPATVENGRVKQIPPEEFDKLEKVWQEKIAPNIVKFVPASGAASRMFKPLNYIYDQGFETISEVSDKIKALESGEELNNLSSFRKFWDLFRKFPFYDELENVLKDNGISVEQEVGAGRVRNILRYLLTEDGMNYAEKPKLFLTFHIDEGRPRVAMEEHIKEAIQLTGGKLHFTVSPGHLQKASELADFFIKQYERRGFDLEISLSVQYPSTDTIALKPDGSVFHRNPDGTLFFRQSGHGALSLNLNRMNSPYLLLQNVDNLPGGGEVILRWKRAFMGYFSQTLERIFDWTRKLADEKSLSEGLIKDAFAFIANELKRPIDHMQFGLKNTKGKARILFDAINRPFVLAAVVPNAGEPGGGPFAVRDPKTGLVTNQIVESAQQNSLYPVQSFIINRSTHFNPVFLILNTVDAWGNRFDLQKYARREGGYVFYVEKSDSVGKKFTSIDTGLWNGEIADMTVLFAEMPIETFGPAKTVLDLNPKVRPFRNNPYPEIAPDIPFFEVLKMLNESTTAVSLENTKVELLSKLPSADMKVDIPAGKIEETLTNLEKVNEQLRKISRRIEK